MNGSSLDHAPATPVTAQTPVTVRQLQDFLSASARRLPGQVALVADGRRWTYAELEETSNALAHALVRRGVRRGDRVLIHADNGPETAIAFWAALKANAVASIVHTQVKAAKLARLIADCRPTAVIVEGRAVTNMASAVESAPQARPASIVVTGSAETARTLGIAEAIAWQDAIGAESVAAPPRRLNLDIDLAAIVYSSGTTGEPKGIMLTHRNMIATASSIVTYLENDERDVILSVLPLSFTYGLYQLVTAAAVGARLALERSFAYPSHVLESAAAERATGLPGVPTMFARLVEMKNLGEFDLSSIRYLTNAAAALPVRHVRALRALLPRARLFSMYGQTECGRGTYLPPERIDRKPDSIGVAIPNTEVWIVDEHDRRLGPGEVGQLVIRGATVMQGYWEKPEATTRRLKPGPLPGEQVLYTGDLCRCDEEGDFYFVGRMDDTIKSRGEKVAPREVETVLMEIPGVREAAVIGVPDVLLGHAVKAFVVLEQDVALTEKGVQLECQKRLEAFMVPQQVAFVPDLPKTASGKIVKAELR